MEAMTMFERGLRALEENGFILDKVNVGQVDAGDFLIYEGHIRAVVATGNKQGVGCWIALEGDPQIKTFTVDETNLFVLRAVDGLQGRLLSRV